MLSFRLILLSVAGGLCLWSLFSLLDNLNEPGLLRSEKAVIVKGCDDLDDEDARRLCPPLLCQKAVLDSKLVPLRSGLNVTLDRSHAGERLIAGQVDSSAGEAVTTGHFACVVERNKVALARSVDVEQLNALAAADGGWLEALSATMRP